MKTWILLLFCSACHRGDDGDTRKPDRDGPHDTDSGAPADDTGDDTGAPSGRFTLSADDAVALPFTTAGEAVPDGALTLREVGGAASEGGLTVEVDGPFEVSGDTGPMGADEVRELVISYSGDVSEPQIQTGSITLKADGHALVVPAAAVLGDPDLPDATWTEDDYGLRTVVDLPSAPFPYGSAPYDDSSVLIFAPSHLTDQGDLGVVTHIHGHNATLTEVLAAQYLVEQHALSGRDAIFIAPQGPEEAADGDFGRLDTEDGYADLVRDAVSVMYRDGLITRPVVAANALSSHSGGYLAVANILDHGGLPIDAVHLFDSLYGQEDVYEDFATSGGTFRSVYTSSGGTDDNNRALRSTLRDEGVEVCEGWDDAALGSCTVTIGTSDASHSGCVYEERAYGRWLTHSGLRQSPLAPPALLATVRDGEQVTVTVQLDLAGGARTLLVQGSDDGESWENLKEITISSGSTMSAAVASHPRLRVRYTDATWGDGAASDTYGATGGDWLVVDGFDRVLGGSWTAFTHDFGGRLGSALGQGFSVASDEGVEEGLVDLGDYAHVLWFLGDESSSDVPLSEDAMAALDDYLDGGGELILSGSELGYAGDSGWLSSALHASYVSDDAGSTTAGGHGFGVIYEEDYPDVWSGDEVIWSYSTGGGAAVGWDHQIVVVGFGLETMEDDVLADALGELRDWLNG